MVELASIKVGKNTKKDLDSLKIHPRETYDDVLIRLIKYKEEKEVGT